MNKKLPVELLILLSDQKVHSGEEIGQLLGISRAAIWKQIQKVESLGLRVESLRGQGYRLVDALDLIDGNYVSQQLELRYGLPVEVVWEIDSTNSQLLRYIQNEGASKVRCVVAEMQSSGRGRRGSHWVSPFAKSLYFSLLWTFDAGIVAIEGLSLVVGISIVEALRDLGVPDVQVKWPNDILVHNRKLAGVLLELQGEPTGMCNVVIGVGLNVYKPDKLQESIDQPWLAIDEIYRLSINRTELLLLVIERLMVNISLFQQEGLAVFMDAWNRYDAYLEKDIVLIQGEQFIFGKALGIGAGGQLLVDTNNGIQAFNCGELSLRLDI